jgi:tetratricopeptide (TPR) repeat protein
VVGEIPGQPPGFVDRTELTDLAHRLRERGRVVVCAGGRGVGKSALAAAYTRAAIGDPSGPRVVAWVSGENELALITGLVELAHRANLTVDGEDSQQSAARARDYLTGLAAPGLLVVDNAEDPDRVRRWLPTGTACQVVLTSTDQTFTALATPVQVGAYTREQSVGYLAERTGQQDPVGAGQVAEALGDLPLALAQAAGVITTQHLTYGRYLSKLTAMSLARVLPAAPGYPHGLFDAIHLSVHAATGRDPQAATMMDVLSVLDPNGITRTLLTALLGSLPAGDGRPDAGLTEDDVDQIVGILASCSLVTVTADCSGVVMHRLVARSLREAHESGYVVGLLDRTAAALHGAIPPEGAPPPPPALVADITGQALALLGHGDLPGETVGHICSTATAVGIWLYTVGAYTEMLTLDERVLAAREQVLGPDHPDTLTSRNNLAVDYYAVGRVGEAITLHERVLAARERVLGPDHPDTLTSRSNLANDYYAVGRVGEAITLHERVLADMEQVLGPDHPNTLTSRNNLANDYQAVGRHGEAIILHEQVLAAREQVLGPDHPNTLTSRNNLAVDYQEVGRHGEAITLHERVLAAMEQVLGPDHPDTLKSRNNLANDYQAVGRVGEAITLHERVLAARERVLGPDHPDTLTSRHNLAIGYREVGRVEEANLLSTRRE